MATSDGWPLLLWPIKRQVATADRIANHKRDAIRSNAPP